MPTQLESGAVKHFEDALLEAAEGELSGQQIEVSATQHAPGSGGMGVESVTIEITADADGEIESALLDYAYQVFVGGEGNLVFQAVQRSQEALEAYGSGNGYSIESVQDSFTGVEARRSGSTITIGYGWDHPAAAYFERGTSDHTIQGDPVLSFIWEDPPGWVREEFEQGRSTIGQFVSGWRVFLPEVDVSGMPAARYIRAGFNWLEREATQ